SRTSAGANTVRYVLEDHQGSIAALATSGGSLAVNESFTPFGQRRSGSTWQLPISGGDQTTINGISRRGYTGHNHLGGAPLIHMNGRVQDPLTGRFLSADPYVANPASTQGWNRYSYVENDPASFTDPSGFVRSCGIGFAAISVPTIGYGFGGGGPDGYGGGGFWFGFETIWMPVISCADIPESAVLPRTDLDTPRYNPLTALTSSEVWKSFLASWQENLDRTGAELSKDPEALLGQAVASIGGPAKVVLGAAGRIAAAARAVTNPVPAELARVVAGTRPLTTLGRAGADDVFVVAADDIAGMNAAQLSQRLTIGASDAFTVIRFPTPGSGIASPVFRTNPGFLQGGLTRGGAREFVIPNGPIPPGSSITVVR
ncbi:MAG: hypothetical protein EPO25_09090, partial [Gammaproteobacteria bacterium]